MLHVDETTTVLNRYGIECTFEISVDELDTWMKSSDFPAPSTDFPDDGNTYWNRLELVEFFARNGIEETVPRWVMLEETT